MLIIFMVSLKNKTRGYFPVPEHVCNSKVPISLTVLKGLPSDTTWSWIRWLFRSRFRDNTKTASHFLFVAAKTTVIISNFEEEGASTVYRWGKSRQEISQEVEAEAMEEHCGIACSCLGSFLTQTRTTCLMVQSTVDRAFLPELTALQGYAHRKCDWGGLSVEAPFPCGSRLCQVDSYSYENRRPMLNI